MSSNVGRITAGYLRFGDAVRVRTAEAANYHVDIPVSGTMVARTGLRDPVYSDPRTAAVFMPSLPADTGLRQRMRSAVPDASAYGRPSGVGESAWPADHASRSTSRPLSTSPIREAPHWFSVLRMVDVESRRPDGLLTSSARCTTPRADSHRCLDLWPAAQLFRRHPCAGNPQPASAQYRGRWS